MSGEDFLSAIEITPAMVTAALRAWWDDRSPGNDPRPAMRAALIAAVKASHGAELAEAAERDGRA